MASRNFTRLTRAELNIVRAIAAGHVTTSALVAVLRQVHAPTLPLSRRTIQSHLNNIYSKTGAQNKADLLLMARGGKPCVVDLVGQMREPARDTGTRADGEGRAWR